MRQAMGRVSYSINSILWYYCPRFELPPQHLGMSLTEISNYDSFPLVLNLTTDNTDNTDLHGSGNRVIARDLVIW